VALREQLEAADSFRAAQVVTWMILRAVAYDLARPDVLVPGQSPLQLDSCQAARCAIGSMNLGDVCLGDGDCIGGLCEISTDPNGVADSDGDCSLRAVFAARSVEDLEAMVSSAVTDVVAADRPLACNAGICEKTIRIRDLYSDPFEAPATRPNLGELLAGNRPLTSPVMSVLPFAISLRRGFLRCSLNPNGFGLTCQTSGVANLSGEQANIGDEASNIWLARVLSVEGPTGESSPTAGRHARRGGGTRGAAAARARPTRGRRGGRACRAGGGRSTRAGPGPRRRPRRVGPAGRGS
jgi:hypothetical protein